MPVLTSGIGGCSTSKYALRETPPVAFLARPPRHQTLSIRGFFPSVEDFCLTPAGGGPGRFRCTGTARRAKWPCRTFCGNEDAPSPSMKASPNSPNPWLGMPSRCRRTAARAVDSDAIAPAHRSHLAWAQFIGISRSRFRLELRGPRSPGTHSTVPAVPTPPWESSKRSLKPASNELETVTGAIISLLNIYFVNFNFPRMGQPRQSCPGPRNKLFVYWVLAHSGVAAGGCGAEAGWQNGSYKTQELVGRKIAARHSVGAEAIDGLVGFSTAGGRYSQG